MDYAPKDPALLLEEQLETLLGFRASELERASPIAEWLSDAELIDLAEDSGDPVGRELGRRYAFMLDLMDRIIGTRR